MSLIIDSISSLHQSGIVNMIWFLGGLIKQNNCALTLASGLKSANQISSCQIEKLLQFCVQCISDGQWVGCRCAV